MSIHRTTKVVGLLVFALLVGGCGAIESGGQASGTSVSIGGTATSDGPVSTRTARPSTPTLRISTVTPQPTAIEPTVTMTIATPGASYTQEEIDYFLEVALGTEYGDSEQTIKKWAEDIKIDVLGTPTDADLQTLETVVEEINSLIDGVEMVVVEQNPNVEMHFAEEDDFGSIEPNYVPVNYGFFWSYWNGNDELYESRILVSTNEITQAERSHLIREEVTQVLGLMNDSNKYSDSIFFEDWTETNSYAEIDKSVIDMLYQEDIEPGMKAKEVVKVLDR